MVTLMHCHGDSENEINYLRTDNASGVILRGQSQESCHILHQLEEGGGACWCVVDGDHPEREREERERERERGKENFFTFYYEYGTLKIPSYM